MGRLICLNIAQKKKINVCVCVCVGGGGGGAGLACALPADFSLTSCGSFRGSVHCVGYDNYTLTISIFQRKTGILVT